jgi:2-octaprenyl-6-methoxyphenol hydroxylase
MTDTLTADAIVVGAGPSGLTAALALASAGCSTVLVGRPAPPDHRTTALLASSVAALETLGIWQNCRDQAAPLRSLRIIDATARLLRGPEIRFDAAEIGLDAFAYNIENRHLVAALEDAAVRARGLRRIAEDAVAVESGADAATVRVASGVAIRAKLVAGADGHRSLCRAPAGIETRARRYPQVALIYNVAHERPHDDISTEFHTESGPFTLVPLPGRRSSIVCVVGEDEAETMQALDGPALDRALERRAYSILGKMRAEAGRGAFPLGFETAQVFAARRIALIGEAAHRIPPIGAQGLNLGLRDAATLAEITAEHADDPGAPEALARYERARRPDVASRTVAVDILNRSLLSDFLPVQAFRGLGLHLLNAVGPLRRAVMREGVMPRTSQPRLMRGESLS